MASLPLSPVDCAASERPASRREQDRGQAHAQHGAICGESHFLRHAYFLSIKMPFRSASPQGRASGERAAFALSCRGAELETAMTDSDAILSANLEFYRAFGAR